MERTCILLVDEYALSREAVCLWLLRVLPDAMVFELSSSSEKFALRADRLNLILFGLRSPYPKAFAMLQDLRSRFPFTPVVLISDTVDDRIITLARAHGASGLFHSSGSSDDLLEAMRHALDGRPFFPPGQHMTWKDSESRFSPRQAEVFNLLCKGKSNKEIAALLNLSGNTVRTHVSAIFNILGVRNRTEAVISAAPDMRDTGLAFSSRDGVDRKQKPG